MKKYCLNLFVLCLSVLCILPIQAFSSDSKSTFSQAELDQLLAPIALYPDSLLSQIFMASTYPADVSDAVKWSKDNPEQDGDKAVTAVQAKSWDPSVMSLAAFPQVLEMMGKESDWVQNLGDAFLEEPDKVMDTVQSLRKKAKDEGNLENTKEQTIVIEQTSPEIIVIEPADPAVVYVPVYNPTVVYGTWWWPSYRPYYYYPPGYRYGSAVVAGIGFGVGVAITNSLWGRPNWRHGDVDINVNRYNNVNVNKNRLDASKKSANWNHNSNNRRGVPYRDKASQKKYSNKVAGADKRRDYRGRDNNRDIGNKTRDAERKRAQSALKKRGEDPAAARKQLSGAGGDKVRNQVSKVDRERGSNFNSGGLRSNSQTKDRAKYNDFSRSHSKASSQNRSRNNSLSGISHQSRTSNNYSRGSRSRSSFSGGGSRARGGGRGRR